MMVGSFGEAAISSVSLVDSISHLLVVIFSAFATGGSVVVSQYLGRKDEKSAMTATRNLMYLTFFAAGILLVVLLPFHRQILTLVYGNLERDVLKYASEYFVPLIISYFFLGFYSSLNAISRSEGKSARTLYVSLVMNGINIVGNATLVVGLGLGPMGAGISTMLSRLFGCSAMLLLMRRKTEVLSLRNLLAGPVDKRILKTIASVAIPQGLESSIFNVGKLLVATLAASLGTSAIAINSVAWNFNSFSNIIGQGLNLATITIIGQCRGADNFRDIKYYTKVIFGIFFVASSLVILPLVALTRPIIFIYNISPESMEEAVPLCWAVLLSGLFIWPWSFTTPSILKACGDVKFILFVNVFSMWAFRVLFSNILIKGFGFGLWGLWLGTFMDWIVRSVVYLIRYHKGKWRQVRLIC
ncbi:MAG: MATE family efflux transporter, partial [Spirochaetales bacterium]|nr:MATE family efflux transporter [Candidatus Physcosoma equi]